MEAPREMPLLEEFPAPPPPGGPSDRVSCPICGGRGEERRQKWFCACCGQLLLTCCD